MVIKQGDIYWVDLGEPHGSEPGFRHPYVIIQNNVFNASKVNTVIGIALTSNISRSRIPGNVLLKKGEANLPKASVVNVTQVMTIDKSDLKDPIGHLSQTRINEILSGLDLVTKTRTI